VGLEQAYSSFSNSSMLESLYRFSGFGEREHFSAFAVFGRVEVLFMAFLPPPDFRKGRLGFED
jgi:hypothetical protein